MGSSLHRIASHWTSLWLGAVLMAALAVAELGCQSRIDPVRVPRMNWLVVPFAQPPTMATHPRVIRGWWFGARTVYQNPRAGEMLAETLTRALASQEYVNLYPALGLKDYFNRKRELLQQQYPYLQPAEIDGLLAEVPATDYARELHADKVLTGRIIRHYMAENRTIHWWWSVLEVECEVLDAATGRSEWRHRYTVRDHFASMSAVQERVARRVARDLEKTYFPSLLGSPLPTAPPQSPPIADR